MELSTASGIQPLLLLHVKQRGVPLGEGVIGGARRGVLLESRGDGTIVLCHAEAVGQGAIVAIQRVRLLPNSTPALKLWLTCRYMACSYMSLVMHGGGQAAIMKPQQPTSWRDAHLLTAGWAAGLASAGLEQV